MTRRRWIADEVSKDSAALTGKNAQHLARVLRAKIGQQFDIAANGIVHRGTVRSISERRVDFDLAETVPARALPEVVLLLSIFKFDRFEWALEKATELGVSRVLPVIVQRTDAHLASAAGKRLERWRRIAKEASQQSRRAHEPQIENPVRLPEAIQQLQHFSDRLLLDENEEDLRLKDALTTAKAPLLVAIGPEGGWSVEERELFAKSGWRSVSLGPTILRAETATIAALVVIFSTLER